MINQIYAVRGATTIDADTPEAIVARTTELARAIVEANALDSVSVTVVSCILSSTDDVTAFYPARALRESGLLAAPVFSCKEPAVRGALKACIRIMVEVASSDEAVRTAKHVYLHGAKALRKDLCDE